MSENGNPAYPSVQPRREERDSPSSESRRRRQHPKSLHALHHAEEREVPRGEVPDWDLPPLDIGRRTESPPCLSWVSAKGEREDLGDANLAHHDSQDRDSRKPLAKLRGERREICNAVQCAEVREHEVEGTFRHCHGPIEVAKVKGGTRACLPSALQHLCTGIDSDDSVALRGQTCRIGSCATSQIQNTPRTWHQLIENIVDDLPLTLRQRMGIPGDSVALCVGVKRTARGGLFAFIGIVSTRLTLYN